ncbi:hypothetical protein D3248_13375 [Leucobacter zeae]|nr:hypothetical protein [Leucobacter zeae]
MLESTAPADRRGTVLFSSPGGSSEGGGPGGTDPVLFYAAPIGNRNTQGRPPHICAHARPVAGAARGQAAAMSEKG